MGRNSRPGTRTPQARARALAELAARQHGNVTRAQLRGLGFTDNAIAHALAQHRLHRVHRGVFAVGRPPVTPLERAAAAVLACGPHAALSHGSAMVLWGLWPYRAVPLEVTVTRGDPRPPGIDVHRSATLAAADLTTQKGIRVTTPARTLLDCAPRMGRRPLIRAVNEARHARILGPERLAEVLARCPHHRGARRLRTVAVGENPTRSPLEDDFPEFCRRFGLPEPLMDTFVAGREADAFFPHEGVIVELDSWEFHGDRHAFEDDRERDASALAAGFPTVRLTSERIRERPGAEAARLHAILARRRGQTTPSRR